MSKFYSNHVHVKHVFPQGNINRSIDSNAAHLFVYNNTKCEYIYITDTFLPYFSAILAIV